MQFERAATGLRRRPAPRGNWKSVSHRLDYPPSKDGLLHSNFSLAVHAPTFSPPHSVFMRSQIHLSSVSNAGILIVLPCASRGARGHGCAFNKDASYPPSVAVKGQDSGLQVFAVSTTAHNAASAFTAIGKITGPVHELLAFSGSVILIRNHTDQLFVCDVRRAGHRMELVRPPLPPLQAAQPTQAEACFETLVFNDFLIILRSRFLAIYSLRLFRQSTSSRGVLHPLAHYVWQWNVDSGRLAFHTSHTRGPQPISILVRFASSFPWPTNMLNHFIIYPNPPGSHSLYNFTPIQVQTISAPLRLFGLSDMAIGDYNTLIWLDTETESYFLQASSGQRLAGCVLGAINEDQVVYANASAVYNVHEGNSWTRVTLDERNGKIAIGTLDGRILVLELA